MNIDEQKQKLLAEKKEIENDLHALGREVNDSGDWVAVPNTRDDDHADDLDNANITEELENNIAVLEVLESRHSQIKKALQAIGNETYGICEVSGEKISEDRLLANPSATTCINHSN